MVDVVLQGEWVLHCIKKNKGNESLLFLAFPRHERKTLAGQSKYRVFSTLSNIQEGV